MVHISEKERNCLRLSHARIKGKGSLKIFVTTSGHMGRRDGVGLLLMDAGWGGSSLRIPQEY